MQRVIYAWNYVDWGGAQIYSLALIKEARKEFDVLVLLPEASDPHQLKLLENEGIRYELFPMEFAFPPIVTRVPKLGAHAVKISNEYAMLRAIRRVGFDESILHVDLLPASSLYSLVWLALRAPVFVTVHNSMGFVTRWRWLLWRLKFGIMSKFENFHVFSANEHAARSFRRLFRNRVADDLKVTYASIHPPQIELARNSGFNRSAERERLGIGKERFVFLTVGQFIDRKGRWTLLEAARIVRAEHPNIDFVWVTPSLPSPEDQARIDSYGLGNGFRLLRSGDIGTDRHSILRFFRIADGFVLPSFVEGLPIALLEAMALGLPSISTNIFGIPEAVLNEETGLLIEPRDANGLAAALLRVYSDRDLRDRLSNNGSEFVMSKFDDRVAAGIAVDEYRKAAGKAADRYQGSESKLQV